MSRQSFLLVLAAVTAYAQQYDLLLTGGHVIDPANNIDGAFDVAISGSKVARVAPRIPAAEARKTVDVRGLYVTPGLVDLHAHVYGYNGALFPDSTSLITGATTVCDAGGAGWRTFEDFKHRIIGTSKTRVLCFLNIVGHGMVAAWEQKVEDMDPAATAEKIKQYPGLIVGVKTAHYALPGWTALERAVEAGRLSNTPVIVDNNILTPTGRNTQEKLLRIMRPGDIHTHTYNDRHLELVDRITGQVKPWMWEARRRGVLFDLGHGSGSFLWPVATAAMAQNFPPDTISTDLHSSSILIPQSDMPNCMSKLMHLGMTLQDAVRRSTEAPAKAIHQFPELGTLGPGRTADIAVLSLEEGNFAFKDAWGKKFLGTRRLANVMTVRDGKIAFDRDGLSLAPWNPSAPPIPPRVSKAEPVYDILIKHGRLIDPANRRDGVFDLAVIGNKIARVAGHLPAAHARNVIEADGYCVTPGLIDIHAHYDAEGAPLNMNPDHNALSSGVTTAVDAGSSGYKGFEKFKRQVIDRAQIRLLAFLNIVGSGMSGAKVENDVGEMDVEAAANMVRKHQDVIVGIKTAHFEPPTWEAVDRAVKAAELTGSVVMADFTPQPGREYPDLILKHLRPGDIHTHVFGRIIPQLDQNRKVKPWMWEARQRGVLFDVGHGSGSFWFRIAAPAIEQGFLPDTISTDQHRDSIMMPAVNMMTTLSKFLNLGLSLQQVIERCTVNAALAIRRTELGTLSEGAIADIAVLALENGRFVFVDSGLEKHTGDKNLRAAVTIRNGKVLWDADGLSRGEWKNAGPYSNYK